LLLILVGLSLIAVGGTNNQQCVSRVGGVRLFPCGGFAFILGIVMTVVGAVIVFGGRVAGIIRKLLGSGQGSEGANPLVGANNHRGRERFDRSLLRRHQERPRRKGSQVIVKGNPTMVIQSPESMRASQAKNNRRHRTELSRTAFFIC